MIGRYIIIDQNFNGTYTYLSGIVIVARNYSRN
jgi:hypothetical protein